MVTMPFSESMPREVPHPGNFTVSLGGPCLFVAEIAGPRQVWPHHEHGIPPSHSMIHNLHLLRHPCK